MLALNNLPKYDNKNMTKILKPWLNVINDYLIIILLTLPVFVEGIELASGRYVCVPVVDCPMSNNKSTPLSKYKHHNVCRVLYSSQKLTNADGNGKTKTIVTQHKYTRRDYDYVNSECRKTAFKFHSYFSSFLFAQAFILLLVNNVWLVCPMTASFVNNFYALAEECYNLPGAQFLPLSQNKQESLTTRESSAPIELRPLVASTSSCRRENVSENTRIAPSTCEGEDFVGVDLATAIAIKTLYDKIRCFTTSVATSQQTQYVYLVQAVLQVLLTAIFFFLSFWFKDIKGTARCSLDEYFPITDEYFTCSHNLSMLLEQAWLVFLIFLGLLCFVSILIVSWAVHKVFWRHGYSFKNELNEWNIPSDFEPAKEDLGFLLHLLHAYDKLYSLQFATYMSEKHHKKYKQVMLNHKWPLEKMEKCFDRDVEFKFPHAITLRGLSGIPDSFFQCIRPSPRSIKFVSLYGCGPLEDWNFIEFETFCNLQSLTAANCGLKQIPQVLLKCTNLIHLALKNNSIDFIQPGIGNLQQLRWFDISGNKLKEIDEGAIGKLKNLEEVDISNNPDMTNMLGITQLILSGGKLNKLFVSISDHSELSQFLSDDEKKKMFVA